MISDVAETFDTSKTKVAVATIAGFDADHTTTVLVAIVYNIGAILGGAYFGALSQGFGRRKTIIMCVTCQPR